MNVLGGNSVSSIGEEKEKYSLSPCERYRFFFSKPLSLYKSTIDLNSMVLLPLLKDGNIKINGKKVPNDKFLIASSSSFSLEMEGKTSVLVGGIRGEFATEFLLVVL